MLRRGSSDDRLNYWPSLCSLHYWDPSTAAYSNTLEGTRYSQIAIRKVEKGLGRCL